MPDMNEFLELAHRAGIGTLNSLAIAKALEISTSYVAKLRSGVEPVRPPIRAKLDALIAAKGDGPVIEGNTIRQTMKLKSDNNISQFVEPVEIGWRKFAVIDATDGTAVLVEIIVPFDDHTAARKICALLNKERD